MGSGSSFVGPFPPTKCRLLMQLSFVPMNKSPWWHVLIHLCLLSFCLTLLLENGKTWKNKYMIRGRSQFWVKKCFSKVRSCLRKIASRCAASSTQCPNFYEHQNSCDNSSHSLGISSVIKNDKSIYVAKVKHMLNFKF